MHHDDAWDKVDAFVDTLELMYHNITDTLSARTKPDFKSTGKSESTGADDTLWVRESMRDVWLRDAFQSRMGDVRWQRLGAGRAQQAVRHCQVANRMR